MKNNENSICRESSIWDLHIHSCKCPKSSGEFQKLSTDRFFEKLNSIFANHKDLTMISFTDHNFISEEVYRYACEMEWDIKVIVGIEVDTYLDTEGRDNKDIKHIIYYFDPDKFDLNNHSRLINDNLLNGPVLLSDFLNFLVSKIRVPFLISPHFMKQGKRGIEFNWVEEIETKTDLNKYIDQMFCFWETSSSVNFQRAHDFLKSFDSDERVSVIAFSDSNDSAKLEAYLDRPHQYFNALPSFEGIRMVGSDVRRIVFNKELVKDEDRPLYIGSVKQGENNTIYFSSKLNAVIGGRGTGKSLLIDGIALYLDPERSNDNELRDRINYLNSLSYQVYDLNNNPLNGHDFRFEYFNQGYVLSLFKSNKDDALGNIYFKEEFSSLKEFDVDSIREFIKQDLAFEKAVEVVLQDNLASICQRILVLDEKDHINYFKKEKEIKTLPYPDFEKSLEALGKPSVVPSELKNNKNIKLKQLELMTTIYEEINKYNISALKKGFYSNFYSAYSKALSNKTNARKTKKKTLDLINNKLSNKFVPIINRVSRINKFLSFKKYYSDQITHESTGFQNNRFVFARELKVQPLLEYLHTVFCLYFDKNKVSTILHIDRDDISNLSYLIDAYCYHPNKYLMPSKRLTDMEEELDNLTSLEIITTSEVYYIDGNGHTTKLRNASPGTKANILMEYIVFKETSVPLLIDQPEDNIDNKTIYKDITEWFNSLKIKRQVIVATHDANIVVNSDAENIVVCSQTQNDIFDYKNGALEYADIINDVSTILDGGKDALERRLSKYGKAN